MNPTKTWGELRYIGRIYSSCSTCGTLRVTLCLYVSCDIQKKTNEIHNCKIFNSDNLRFNIMSMILVPMILYCLHSYRLTSGSSSAGRLRIYNLCLFLLTKNAQQGVRAKTGSLEFRIMCPSGAMYMSTDCCFSELAL